MLEFLRRDGKQYGLFYFLLHRNDRLQAIRGEAPLKAFLHSKSSSCIPSSADNFMFEDIYRDRWNIQ